MRYFTMIALIALAAGLAFPAPPPEDSYLQIWELVVHAAPDDSGQVTGSAAGLALPDALPVSAYERAYYTFRNWNVSGNCSIANPLSNSTMITVNGGTCYATAYFNYAPPAPNACVCGMPLNTPNHVCNMTEDLNSAGDCFDVNADNVTIQCNGHRIIGDPQDFDAYGVFSSSHSYTKVLNCDISDFDTGIYFFGANYNVVSNSTVALCRRNGILLELVDNSSILGTAASSTFGNGIMINGGNGNTVLGSSGEAPVGGITLQSADDNHISGSNATSYSTQALIVQESYRNVFTAINAQSARGMALFIFESSNNTFYSSSFTSAPDSATDAFSSNNSFIGCNASTWDGSALQMAPGNGSIAANGTMDGKQQGPAQANAGGDYADAKAPGNGSIAANGSATSTMKVEQQGPAQANAGGDYADANGWVAQLQDSMLRLWAWVLHWQ